MTNQITLERTYPHPVAKVWRALTDPELVSQWLMPTDLVAEEGREFTFRTKPYPGFDGTVRCRVLRVDVPRELVFSWSGGGLQDTEVSFRLEALDGGAATRLHFAHTGFSGLLNRLITRNILAAGWRGELLGKKLPALLDRL